MRILTVVHVITSFNSASGGPPRTVISIGEALQGLWNGRLVTTDVRQPEINDLSLLGQFRGQVFLLPSAAIRTVESAAATFGVGYAAGSYREPMLGPPRADVIHLNGLWSPMLAAAAAASRHFRIPYIVTPHGMLEPWSLSVRPLRKRLALLAFQKRVLQHASAIHVTSELEAKHLRDLALTPAPIVLIPNAVDAPTTGADRSWAEGLTPRKLLFMSRLHPKKGLDLLLKAWHEVQPDGWRLVIAGTGDPAYETTLHELTRQLGLNTVDFLGHVDGPDREAVYASASAFILPTFSENFGNVIAEAMLRELPVDHDYRHALGVGG